MSQSGFFEQKRASPSGLAIVIALHAGVLGALVMIKGPPMAQRDQPIDIEWIPTPPLPEDVEPPPPPPRDEVRLPPMPIPTIPLPPMQQPPLDTRPLDPGPVEPQETVALNPPIPDPPPAREPVRRDATVDPRFASALQPPYPLDEQRAQRTGTVRMRVTIGTDGRVKAVERLSATSDSFWEVARSQALNRWRFRPATLDGRPVESTKIMSLQFRLADI